MAQNRGRNDDPAGRTLSEDAPAPPKGARRADEPFAIVAVGVCPEGREALELFLKALRAEESMAVVVVRSADTSQGTFSAASLDGRAFAVVEARDEMEIRPGRVYVLPPGKSSSLRGGALRIEEPDGSPMLPIDGFFRSLAENFEHRGVAVILSGRGTDGTLGLRAVKEKSGLVLAQEPEDGPLGEMPRAAAATELVDSVAPPEELPEKLFNYLGRPHLPKERRDIEAPERGSESVLMTKIWALLRNTTGTDFSGYKDGTVKRRLERRMGIHRKETLAAYHEFLRDNPFEQNILAKELLIGVTRFFRDPQVWQQLRDQALPELLSKKRSGNELRAWVAGCSTGEEAYSLAMVLKEALGTQWDEYKELSIKIFATDLDADAVEKARRGYFDRNIVADVSDERLERFFIEDGAGFRVRREIREMVVFATQNLIADPPFTNEDIILCRNLLIYLRPELQNKILPLFHYSLLPGGILVLGTAESLGDSADLFTQVGPENRVFVSKDTPSRLRPVLRPPPTPNPPERVGMSHHDLESIINRLLLVHHAPAAVLTNPMGDILHIHGRTGRYLEPTAGKANWNAVVMAREGLRHELASSLRRAVKEHSEVVRKGLKVKTNGRSRIVDLVVQPVDGKDTPSGLVLTVLADRGPSTEEREDVLDRAPTGAEEHDALEFALRETRQELIETRAEAQTSEEELMSTNEELQSANEELQSTNEELNTSREELSSLNEELQTVNSELQAKVEELTTVNDDMVNLLNSTDIATVFLDDELCVRRFTPQSKKLFKLRSGDLGRPLSDLATELNYSKLYDDAHEVLRTLVFCEKQISTQGDRWFESRIMPYRTQENKIDGLVITFTDITEAKRLEKNLREANKKLAKMTRGQACEIEDHKKTQ